MKNNNIRYCLTKAERDKAIASGGQLIGKKKISGHDCYVMFFKDGCIEKYEKNEDHNNVAFAQFLTFQ